MADPDAVRRSLGLKPRRPAGESDASEEESAEAAPAAAEAPAERPKRERPERAERPERDRFDKPAPRPPDAEPPEPVVDPRRKPVGKLPVEAQRLLRNWYILRPEMDLPPHLHELDGTWGRFYGDGREEREVQLGFRPAFVLFTMPLFPTGGPRWVTKKGSRGEGELVDPGLHDQPAATDRGFMVGIECNLLGEACTYIAWKSDGREAAPPPDDKPETKNESPREARRREQLDKRKRDLEARRTKAASRRR